MIDDITAEELLLVTVLAPLVLVLPVREDMSDDKRLLELRSEILRYSAEVDACLKENRLGPELDVLKESLAGLKELLEFCETTKSRVLET